MTRNTVRVPAFRTAATSFVLELGRRWLTLAFMLLLPSAFFVTMFLIDGGDGAPVTLAGAHGPVVVEDRAVKAIYLTMLGIGIAGSFSALASLKDKMPLFQRLRLIGFGTAPLLAARLTVLAMIVAASTLLFTVLLVILVPVYSFVLTLAGAALGGLIGVALGTALGLLLNREFEASMILIAVCGMQMALGRSGASAEQFLPFWPAVKLLEVGVFDAGSDPLGYLALGAGYVVVLLAVSFVLWQVKTAPRGSTRPPRHRHRATEDSRQVSVPASVTAPGQVFDPPPPSPP